MNRWFANAFGNILTVVHALFILFCFWAFNNEPVLKQTGTTRFDLVLLFLGYVVVMGFITTIISINLRLQAQEEIQKEMLHALRTISMNTEAAKQPEPTPRRMTEEEKKPVPRPVRDIPLEINQTKPAENSSGFGPATR